MKLRNYGLVTATVLAALTLGTDITSHADETTNSITSASVTSYPNDAIDALLDEDTSKAANQSNTDLANNTSNQVTVNSANKVNKKKSAPKVANNASFVVVANHNGFAYSDVNLKSRTNFSYKIGDQLRVNKVYKSGNRLRYAIENKSGNEEYISAYYTYPKRDDRNMAVYNTLHERAEVKANFLVKTTRAGLEYANANLAGGVSGMYYENQQLQVLGVNHVNNKFRYLVVTKKGLYYISAYNTKPVAGKANMKAYNAARNAFLNNNKPAKTKKTVAKKVPMRVAKKAVKKVTKKRVVKKESKRRDVKRIAPYYEKLTPGRHVVIVKKDLIQHATKSFKDRSGKYKRNNIKRGKRLVVNYVTRAGRTYRLHLTNGKFITASTSFVRLIK